MSLRQCRGVGRLSLSAAFVAGCLAVAGCTAAPTAVDVSGEVTFDGKPIPAGRIYFNADVTKGNDGPQGYADIIDGKFDTRNKGGKGAHGGPTVAVIEGYDGNKQANPSSQGQRLFKKYSVAVELPKEACTKNFEVPASAAKGLVKTTGGERGP